MILRHRTIATLLLLGISLATMSLFGAERERKLIVTAIARPRPIPADVFTGGGARIVEEYEAMRILAVAPNAVDRVTQNLATGGYQFVELDDLIRTPRHVIDPHTDLPPRHFPSGLFLVQFTAPAKAEWHAQIASTGATVVDSLSGGTVIVAATVDQIGALAHLPWVQCVGAYIEAYKYAIIPAEGTSEFTIHIADTHHSAGSIARISDRAGGFITESRHGRQLTARVMTTAAVARELIADPFVIAIEQYIPPRASDERQALGLTGVSRPAGADYLSWLSQHGITPNQLTQSGIVIDVADSGVDLGCIYNTSMHADLVGRRVYHGGPIGFSVDYKDEVGHGTAVASIAGGNPVSGIDNTGNSTSGYAQRDFDAEGQFYYGLGVAPGVRIGSTKMLSGTGKSGTVEDWTKHAVSRECNTPTALCTSSGLPCPATVQNHSNNEHNSGGTNAGIYTSSARDFDISVRDATRTGNPATLKQLAITFSAGNYGQNASDPTRAVMAPATAKNVISVGATESVRESISTCTADTIGGNNPALRHSAQGYRVLAYTSRRGTSDGRLKPDVVAPATLAFSAHSEARNTSFYCGKSSELNGFVRYHGGSGTSFAAPVVAGSIALLRYHYTTQYAAAPPSPAMYKAMLVAGSRSITGEVDRQETYLSGVTKTVTAWPNAQQGFGLVTLADLLNPAVVKTFHDQQTVLLQGQMFERTVTVADPTRPVRIVLAWTDAPATAGAAIAEVNGLNLTAGLYDGMLYGNFIGSDGYSQTSPGCGRPVCPSPSDSRNNVEVIHINPSRFSNTANRTFSVRIMASPLNAEAVPDGDPNTITPNQDFALFVMNGRF